MILVIVLIIILLLILASCLKIVPQAHAYVIERLGAYQGTWSVGFHMIYVSNYSTHPARKPLTQPVKQ